MVDTTAIPAAGPSPSSRLALNIAVGCVMLSTFMQALDTTVANVALPYMQGSLQAARDQITWVLTSYVIVGAIITPPIGWLATRFGRKELLLVSVAGFTLASMLCGIAANLEEMIAFRLLQGMFGAALQPLSQSIVLDSYPIEQRGWVMSIWSMFVFLGPILGPTLGGFLTEYYSWRWVFYVNVPVGMVAAAGIYVFLSEKWERSKPRFDWLGFTSLSIALASLQLLLDRGTEKDWFESPEIVIEALIAGVGFYLFLVQLFTSEHTLFDKKTFRDRNFVEGLILNFFIGNLTFAFFALLPTYLENLGGYSVLETGFLLAPRGIATMLTMLVVGRIVMKADPRAMMLTGALVTEISLWIIIAWTPDVSTKDFVMTTFFQGTASALIVTPMNLYIFATLEARYRTDAASISTLVRNFGQAVGVSVSTAVLSASNQTAFSQLAAHVSPFNRTLYLNGPALFLNPVLPPTAAQLAGTIARQSSIIAYTDTFVFLFYCGIPIVAIILMMRKVDLLAGAMSRVPETE
jgi:MFS transporter, DHA2 family, multidrug resistance protein